MNRAMKINFLTVLMGIVLCFPLLAESTEQQIKQINRNIEDINDTIESGELGLIKMENIIVPLESVPPEICFYYDYESGKLKAVIVNVGHETWSKSFHFYFDGEERIMKYLEVIDRPDNPPRTAIFYDYHGNVLWSNRDNPVVDPIQLRTFYQRMLSFQIEFSVF